MRKQTWKGSLRPIKAELNNLVKIHQRSDQNFSHKERLLEAIKDPKVSQEFCCEKSSGRCESKQTKTKR